MTSDSVGSRAFVPATRVRVPRTSTGLVARPRLMDDGIGRAPVSLVCAPAGSGKTVLVTQWASAAGERGEPVAWLSVETNDDRPYEFWSAVIEALIAVAPPDAARRLEAFSPPQHRFEPRFIAALVAVLASEPGLRWLVLDDTHLIRNQDVVAGVDVLLTQAHPGFGVVLVGRFDPPFCLHKLRLSGTLNEIRAVDLAFTAPEAAGLFAALDIALHQPDLARLVSRTEGWAAGLRLAALSLTGADDPEQFISAFEGDQRAVADYLFAEIVQHLPSDVHEFLLNTCAPEQLSVDLAASLSARSDAGELLDRLCRANALVVQSGDTSCYRYHSLMRTYLMAALGRRDVNALPQQHARTARWFDEHDEPAIALGHAVLARYNDLVRELLRRDGLRLILSGRPALVASAIAAAPAPVREDELTMVLAALAALDTADVPIADEWLAAVDSDDPRADPRAAAMLASALVQRALLGGDVAVAVDATAILDQPMTGDSDVDLIVLGYRAAARMRSGDYSPAISDLQQALAIARHRGYDQFVLWTLSQLAGITGAMCDFAATRPWVEQAIAFATLRGWSDSPRLAYAYLLAAWTAFQTGDTAGQAYYADLGIRSLDGANNVEVDVGVRSMHALARYEAGAGPARRDAVATFHSIWQSAAAEQVSPALIGLATPQEVRIALAVGEWSWAEAAVDRIQRQLPHSAEVAMMRAQLAAARGRTRDALRLLAPALNDELTTHVPTTSVITNVLAAVLETSLGNDTRAFDALERSLVWAAPNNYRRPFVDAWSDLEPLFITHLGRFGVGDSFVGALLDDQRRNSHSPSALNRTLTLRELDFLRDLPSLLPVHEIAAARGISVNTAKTHLRSIYRKLGVSSRSEAVREGRARGLL